MFRFLVLGFLAVNFIDSKYLLVETEESSEAGKVVEPIQVLGHGPHGYEKVMIMRLRFSAHLLLQKMPNAKRKRGKAFHFPKIMKRWLW